MVKPFLTSEMLGVISKMPAAQRRQAMTVVAQEEWSRCAEDIFYWIDPARHPLTYVYTKDNHPMHVCQICQDGATYHFSQRQVHLLSRHKISAGTDAEQKVYFHELDTIRPFTMMPYFEEIIQAWLREPLLCIEKSRDMMATWLIVVCYTWDALFHKGRQHIFQSETAMKTHELCERVMVLANNQPRWLREVAPASFSEGSSRAGYVKIPKMQSEIIGFPQGADKVRQFHPTGFFSDEAAFNPEAGDCFAAIKPAIQNGGRYTAVSSANPSFFQHLCRDTVQEVL